ncbi:hypothetical protein Nm8I071_37520 [Nonomuraea sp. TT08I-71]|nr:hypothetical protein Nm8I071_37520 [Nonomuraea sp. TT08I-71]
MLADLPRSIVMADVCVWNAQCWLAERLWTAGVAVDWFGHVEGSLLRGEPLIRTGGYAVEPVVEPLGGAARGALKSGSYEVMSARSA